MARLWNTNHKILGFIQRLSLVENSICGIVRGNVAISVTAARSFLLILSHPTIDALDFKFIACRFLHSSRSRNLHLIFQKKIISMTINRSATFHSFLCNWMQVKMAYFSFKNLDSVFSLGRYLGEFQRWKRNPLCSHLITPRQSAATPLTSWK